MRKPKRDPKNPLGLTNAELRAVAFWRHAVKRQQAAPRIREARERKADDAQIRRLDRRATTIAHLEKRLKLLALFPSASAVLQCAEILRDPRTPEDCRVKAAGLILRLADFGDGPSPG